MQSDIGIETDKLTIYPQGQINLTYKDKLTFVHVKNMERKYVCAYVY